MPNSQTVQVSVYVCKSRIGIVGGLNPQFMSSDTHF